MNKVQSLAAQKPRKFSLPETQTDNGRKYTLDSHNSCPSKGKTGSDTVQTSTLTPKVIAEYLRITVKHIKKIFFKISILKMTFGPHTDRKLGT